MSSRLPRFRRVSAPNDFAITERDRTIIKLVHRHRFLRSSHIAELAGGSRQGILRRLQSLFHHGYLERPRCQIDSYHRGGSREIAYGLGRRGEMLLAEEAGIAVRKARSGEKNRAVGRPYLDHELLVSEFMTALEVACRKTKDIRLLWPDDFPAAAGKPPSSWKASIDGREKLGVRPDRIFAVEFPNQGHSERILFFLEADRGTMPVVRKDRSQTSVYRKLLAYEATWSQSVHRTHFGFHRFRVLTVTSSAARLKSLVEACSALKRGHGLFLFADRAILENPEEILSSKWQACKSGDCPLFTLAVR